jgi:hypothetical protein
MSKAQIILLVVYACGFLTSYSMLKIEHEAEKRHTRNWTGSFALQLLFSHFFSVLLLLVSSWFKKIAATGYWDRPVTKRSE